VSAVKTKSVAAPEGVSTWINLQQANRVIEAVLETRLQSAVDLSLAEFELLMRLEVAADHPLQMSQIAAQLINSPSGTTRIADRLERASLIERETPRENRRVVHVKLTARGREVLGRGDLAFREGLQEVFGSHLSDAEVASLRSTLRKLLEGNNAWTEARCAPPIEESH
jgi:DNA-binding MarR family transcriptional regulator